MAHRPTVAGGRALVLYLPPEGRIDFTAPIPPADPSRAPATGPGRASFGSPGRSHSRVRSYASRRNVVRTGPARALQLRRASDRAQRGRPAKAAHIDDAGTPGYGELGCACAAAPPRCAAGVRREERVLLLMHDCSDWPVAFPRRDVRRRRAGRRQHAADRRRRRLHARPLPRAGGARLRRAAADAAGGAGAGAARGQGDRRLAQWRAAAARTRSTSPEDFRRAGRFSWPRPPRPGPDDPGFWLYSSAPPAAPRARCTRTPTPYWTAELYGTRVLGPRGRRLLLGGQAVLRLRPGQRAVVPAPSARRRS